MTEEAGNTNFLLQNIAPLSILLLPFLFYFVFKHTRRITRIEDIPLDRNFVFKAFVSGVGDGDGFKGIHIPLLGCVPRVKSAGSTARPTARAGRSVRPTTRTGRPATPTLSVRLAGVDAPEVRYFNRPPQPFSREARDELRSMILGKVVRIQVLDIDPYGRIVGIVSVGVWRKNVNVEMVKKGLACVYKGKRARFGGMKERLEKEEGIAREKRIGIWSQRNYISPMDYKRAMGTGVV